MQIQKYKKTELGEIPEEWRLNKYWMRLLRYSLDIQTGFLYNENIRSLRSRKYSIIMELNCRVIDHIDRLYF